MNTYLFCAEDLSLPDGTPVTSWSPRLFDGIDDMIAFDAMLHPPLPQVAYHPSGRAGRLVRSAQAAIRRWQADRTHVLVSLDPDEAPRSAVAGRWTVPEVS